MNNSAKAFIAAIGFVFGLVVIVALIGWLAKGADFSLFKFFAPREEAVRRQVTEESKAYNDGVAQELFAFHMEYVKGDQTTKDMLASTILHRYASYPEDKIQDEVTRKWFHELKTQKGLTTN